MSTSLLLNVSNQLGKLYLKSPRAFLSRQSHPVTKRQIIRRTHTNYITNHRSISSSSIYNDKATSKAAATEAADAAIDDSEVNGKLAARLIKPKPLFPWRHSPHPLPRLIRPADSQDGAKYYESDYYAKGGHLGPGWPGPMPSWFRIACQANSMRLLGLPYSSMLVPWTRNAWLHDMEDAFCDAFGKGVNGLIMDTYSMEGVYSCSVNTIHDCTLNNKFKLALQT